jgi:hypothetical protein
MTITQLLMIQTIGLSNVAWDYCDGETKTEKPSKNRLVELPSFLEFMAAGLCPTQVLAGPSSHLSDFLNYIYRRNEYASEISTGFVALQRFLTGITWVVIYAVILSFVPFEILYTNAFHNSNFFTRVFFFVYILAIHLRNLWTGSQGKILRLFQVSGSRCQPFWSDI